MSPNNAHHLITKFLYICPATCRLPFKILNGLNFVVVRGVNDAVKDSIGHYDGSTKVVEMSPTVY